MKTTSNEKQAVLDRLNACLKAIPAFRSDMRRRIRNSIDYTKRGMITPVSTLETYESAALMYGEDYERRAELEEKELQAEIDG